MNDGGANKAEPPTSCVNFRCNDIEADERLPDREPSSPPVLSLEPQPVPFHTLILDLAGVCFIDLMGIKVLIKVIKFSSVLVESDFNKSSTLDINRNRNRKRELLTQVGHIFES